MYIVRPAPTVILLLIIIIIIVVVVVVIVFSPLVSKMRSLRKAPSPGVT